MTCNCPPKDWFDHDQSWIQYSPDCPGHSSLAPTGLLPTEPPKEDDHASDIS